PHALLEQGLRGAERNEIGKGIRAAPPPAAARGNHARTVEGPEPRRRKVQEARNLAQREQIGEGFAPASVRFLRPLRLLAAFHATAAGPENDVDDLVVALFLPTHRR